MVPLRDGPSEITEEEFLKEVTSSDKVVCVFYHNDFVKCGVMDKVSHLCARSRPQHMRILAPQLAGTKFIRLNADKAPFFVGKLKIRTMPTAVFFQNGVAIDKQIGFDGLGGTDDFATGSVRPEVRATPQLVRRLARAGMLETADMERMGLIGAAFGSSDEDDDDGADVRRRD
jgi:hypothetical protein